MARMPCSYVSIRAQRLCMAFFMIMVTRINKVEVFYINEDLIEFIEETPDTIISLESGKKVVVMESAETVIDRILQEKRKLHRFWNEG